MRHYYKCEKCKKVFEELARPNETLKICPCCGATSKKQFQACTNIYIPSYFHTSKSDIFSDTEWQDLKRNPDIERA